MICVGFHRKPFTITVIQVCAPTTNAKEGEVEHLCEDLQDLLELTPKPDVLFIIEDQNVKVGSQEIPGVTGKFVLEYKMKQGKVQQFCRETAPVIANTLVQQHKRQLYPWTSPDG